MASAGWERRNARAQQLGYQSYYDYRAHDYGRRPPGEPRSTGEELSRLRGHRGAADLKRLLKSGRVELMNVVSTVDAKKRFTVEALVTLSDGTQRQFSLRGADIVATSLTIDDLGTEAPPIVGSPRTLKRMTGAADSDFVDTEPTHDIELDLADGTTLDISDVAEFPDQ